ncbi:MAG: dihydrodipicolinate synthase family protein [Chloroflexi bacterium]|nr:dihydrodipicolinate synthase family protein [Chloroflexota bacterium]
MRAATSTASTASTIGGIICPLATPLDDAEDLDVPALHLLLDRLLPDLDGVFALGSSGEFALLRPSTAEHLVDEVIAHVGGRVPVYVGVGDTGTARALANLKRLTRPGVDYIVACSSFYYPISDQDALAGHFLAIAEASSLPVLLYNIPQNTATPLAPATAARLAEHPNIVGMKDSWGDMMLHQEFLALLSSKFAVIQGREQLAAASLWLGGDGIISGLSNFAPELLQQIAVAVREGDRAKALEVQRAATTLAQVFDQGYWLSALKATLAELGIGNGRSAAPLPACTASQRANIRRILQVANIAGVQGAEIGAERGAR